MKKKPNGEYYCLVDKHGETFKLIAFGQPELTITFDTQEEAEEELEWQLDINFDDDEDWHVEKRYIDFDKELQDYEDDCRNCGGNPYPNPFDTEWPDFESDDE